MWQESLVGGSGGYSPTKLQPAGVTFKGTTRYVSQNEAKAYTLSQELFSGALYSLLGIAIIGVLIARGRARGRPKP